MEQQVHLLSHVGGELDYLVRASAGIEDRVVAGLDPDLPTALAEPPVLARLILALLQALSERGIFGAAAVVWIDEQAVVLSPDLVERVAHRVKEVAVCRQDDAVEIELDDGLRPVECGEPGSDIGVGLREQGRHGNLGLKFGVVETAIFGRTINEVSLGLNEDLVNTSFLYVMNLFCCSISGSLYLQPAPVGPQPLGCEPVVEIEGGANGSPAR
jgi:hypothetical protein